MRAFLRAIALLLALVSSPAHAADDPALLPDPLLTPGAIDPTISLHEICEGATKGRRHVSAATRAKVLAGYGITADEASLMELDHLVPLSIGGSNDAANLWPQPWPDYGWKDHLEVELQRRACVAYRTLQPAEAADVLRQVQDEIANDWVAAADRYSGENAEKARHASLRPGKSWEETP